MEKHEADAVVAILTPLLRAFEVLSLVARHLHPPRVVSLVGQIGTSDDDLRAARSAHSGALAELGDVGKALDAASDAALNAFAGLREAAQDGDIRGVYRALRFVSRGLEALYPLAGVFPPMNRFFLDPSVRSDATLQSALLHPTHDKVGVMRFAAEEDTIGEGERGGFWLYVPENYTSDRTWPVVMALHGGSGTGRQFLWSWLRDARSRGAILIAPTAIGQTWALNGDDVDTPNLLRILAFVRASWNVDPQRLLLTGMSDGGTFTYVSGLDAGSPFTHLAPISAAFHPMLAPMIDPDRMQGLPIHIVHGALDWMFPATMAREAQATLAAAGADVTYREIDDLSHTYPREMNAILLAWLAAEG